jgi:hypothetical protein
MTDTPGSRRPDLGDRWSALAILAASVALFETCFVSPQPFLWDMAHVEWQLVRRARPYRVRRKGQRLVCNRPCSPK